MKKLFPLLFVSLFSGCVSTEMTRTTTSEVSKSPEPIRVGQASLQSETLPAAQRATQSVKTSAVQAGKSAKVTLVQPEPAKHATKTKDGKLILGHQEWVWFNPAKQFVRAHVVQAQSVSTLGVNAIVPFERDGRPWVKFKVLGKALEMPVDRWQESDEQELAVVQVRTVLGELNEMTDFVLVEGQDVRLGADFIRDVAVVDTSRKYVQPKTKMN